MGIYGDLMNLNTEGGEPEKTPLSSSASSKLKKRPLEKTPASESHQIAPRSAIETSPDATGNPSDHMQPVHHATTQPRNHATVIPRYHDVVVEAVRKAVKEFGKEAATHRFTAEEKRVIRDIVYAYEGQGVRTSENEITRIAVNFLIGDYQDNRKNSLLDKVLRALNQ